MSHVAVMIPTLDRVSGAERQVVLLAHGLARRGWRVTVIALSGDGGEQGARLIAGGIGLVCLGMRKGLADPRGWLRLRAWLRRERTDVLHAHLPHAAWMARWMRLLAPVRVVVDTIHTAGTGSWGRRVGYRWSGWLTDRVTAVSEGAAQAWIQARMVAADRVMVIPNGVDTELWKPDGVARAKVRAALQLQDEFLWLAAGRLEPVKDFASLLCAFAELPGDARLVIAGDGSQADALRELAESLGVAGRVRFAGFVADVRSWMQAADGFVLSSRWEGLPMSLLEAGACALSAVSTNVAGAAEILAGEQSGLLARAEDTDSLRDAMTGLMHMTRDERWQMGQRARRRVVERYAIATVLDRWEALYAELLARRSIGSTLREDDFPHVTQA